MNKLSLDLDGLRVESFVTGGAAGRGTVAAYVNTYSGPCGTADRLSTCAVTCPCSMNTACNTDLC
ncbi:MAG TPA: hypothetical protein VHG08_03640 [Longimicrobium sp.]|nr:hypothetical protein [Longimicrobium sp.]